MLNNGLSRYRRLAGGIGALALFAGVAACSGGSGSDDDLVMYSSMTENDLDVLLDLLAEEFPDIDVEIVNGSAGELTTRINSEKGSPQGDFMWGGLDVMDGDAYSDIFEDWLSDYEDDLPDEYKSPNGFYNVDHLSTVAFAVNTELADELGVEVRGYEDLLDPRLKGKILIADPTSSSSAWNNLSNILAVYGYEEDETWDYISDLLDNDIVIASSSSAPFASVEDGEYVVGLTYEDGIAAMQKGGAEKTELVYPEEGTSASAFGTAVIEGAPNGELAKEVINYIMSPEGQTALGEELGTIRMTTTEEYESEFLPPADDIEWVERDVEWLTENRDDVVSQWEDLYTDKR